VAPLPNYAEQLFARLPSMSLAQSGFETAGVVAAAGLGAKRDELTQLVRSLVDRLNSSS